ncbi:MAG: SRPBCC family protein, partial [Actinobacteria bacterium]|nr:SRPBCC family protein [Actinomycetota bacterium]
MPRIKTEIEIARSPEETFDYLTDLRNAIEWSTELVDVTYDGDLKAGSTGTDLRKMGRKEITMPWTVTAYERPDRIVLEYGPPFPAIAEFSFRPTAAGTVVTCDTDLRLRGWWRLLSPVIAKEAAKTDEVQFNKVKAILEART